MTDNAVTVLFQRIHNPMLSMCILQLCTLQGSYGYAAITADRANATQFILPWYVDKNPFRRKPHNLFCLGVQTKAPSDESPTM